MKKTTGLGLGLVALGGIALLASRAGRNNEAIAKEMITKWSPIILQELGMKNEENILDKIKTAEGAEVPGTLGQLHHAYRRQGGFATSRNCSYVPGSASISIYTGNINYIPVGKTKMKNPVMFGKAYRRIILFTLAHELRHFWQVYTGEYYKHDVVLNGVSIMPYNMQWCEQDANDFAMRLLKKYKTKI